jgi:FOG: Ankyrin repeat
LWFFLLAQPLGADNEAQIWTRGNTAAIQRLIEKTENINKADGDGDTPLMLAARYNSDEAIRLLINNGAAPNLAKPPMMFTPLMFAALYNPWPEKALTALVSQGADIDARDRNGKTALIHAAAFSDKGDRSKNRGEAVVALLTLGADPFITDKAGMTANHYGRNSVGLSNSRARELLALYSHPSDSPFLASNQPAPPATDVAGTSEPPSGGAELAKADAPISVPQPGSRGAGPNINITIIGGDQHNNLNQNGRQTVTNVGGDQTTANNSQVNKTDIDSGGGDASVSAESAQAVVDVGDDGNVKTSSVWLNIVWPGLKALIPLALLGYLSSYIYRRLKPKTRKKEGKL